MLRLPSLFVAGLLLAVVPNPTHGQASPIARGAQLWNATCNRCHNRRSPVERTDAQWSVITSHMRTRANLTQSEAEAIAAFLQQANGRESSPPTTSDHRSTPDSTGTSSVRPENTGDATSLGQVPQIDRRSPTSGAPSVLGPRLLRGLLKNGLPEQPR